jgi:2-dehydropantoate 2-reductase
VSTTARPVTKADPKGIIAANIENERIIGSRGVSGVSELVEPGVIKFLEGNRFSLGELDNSKSERRASRRCPQAMIPRRLQVAGFHRPARRNVGEAVGQSHLQSDLSALTHATLAGICRFPLTRELAAGMMREAQAGGRKARRARMRDLDRQAHRRCRSGRRTQDLYAAGRRTPAGSLELDALLGTVR